MAQTEHFSLRRTPAEKASFIISVSKKVSKKAVTRNLIRRRVRPVLHSLRLKITPAAYFLSVKPRSESVKGKMLKDELQHLFKL